MHAESLQETSSWHRQITAPEAGLSSPGSEAHRGGRQGREVLQKAAVALICVWFRNIDVYRE